jgi:hypothetical protein
MDADERPDPILPVLLAWLVPGAGHLKIGKLWPGVFVFSAILPLYVAGMALTGFENVSWERHPIYFYAAHIFGGLLTGAAALLTRHVDVREYMADRSTGELFTAVACLLNIVAIADVWSRCSRGDPETRIRARADADAETAAAAAAADAPPQVPSAAPSPAPEVSGG